MEEARLYLTAIGILIALVALFVAIRNFRRKTGILVRGSFGICDSTYCEEPYISNIILENLKDRSITIFSIYLRVGRSYYIEIENFEEKPMILRPYETYHKEYGPIEFYAVSSRKISLRKILKDYKTKKRIYLSTSDGKYCVPAFIKHWNPVYESLINKFSAVVRPIISKHKGTYVGSNAKLLVEFTHHNGKDEVVPLRHDDYELEIFRNFRLTRESLTSKAALEELIEKEILKGNISCKSFEVHDLDKWRKRHDDFYRDPPFEAPTFGIFRYYLLGHIPAKIAHWRHIIRSKFRLLK